MVGDVSFILTARDPSYDGEEDLADASPLASILNPPSEPSEPSAIVAVEVTVMIADRSMRRKGLAAEAVLLGSRFIVGDERFEGAREFVAKIVGSNAPSLALFQRIGYKIVKEVKVFDEIHLLRTFDDTILEESTTL